MHLVVVESGRYGPYVIGPFKDRAEALNWASQKATVFAHLRVSVTLLEGTDVKLTDLLDEEAARQLVDPTVEEYIKLTFHGPGHLSCSWCCSSQVNPGDEFIAYNNTDTGGFETVCAPCFNFSPDWVGLTAQDRERLEPKIDDEVFALQGDGIRCFKCSKLGHRFMDCTS